MAPLKVAGTIRVPGDKSISHRALILAALADGESVVRDVLVAEDTASTASALRALGAVVPPLAPEMRIAGRGLRQLVEPGARINCGNSGTTARLLAGVVAGHPFRATFTGDESLSRRPMRRVAEPLTAMGARVELGAGDCLPMTVHGGKLNDIEWATEVPSAQVKSAILLAGLVAGVRVMVREPLPSRSHTERMMRALGRDVRSAGATVELRPGASVPSFEMVVPGDPSSASFFAALAALSASGSISLPGVCVDADRLGFMRALVSFGAHVEISDSQESMGEQTGTITISPGRLRAFDVNPTEIPSMIDELPILACVASRAEGKTTVRGAAELRVKESDRIRAVVANLRTVGADAEELPDGFAVRSSTRPLRGRVVTHGDHRIAMAFAVLGAIPGNEIEIDDPDCVSVSYPEFWTDLARVVA